MDDVLAVIGDAFDPVKGMRREQTALKRLGFDEGSFIHLHRDWCITPEAFRRLSWKRRALITVPSLNIPEGWHMVYSDGRQLYDPSVGITYEAWDRLLPDEIILFDEHPSARESGQ